MIVVIFDPLTVIDGHDCGNFWRWHVGCWYGSGSFCYFVMFCVAIRWVRSFVNWLYWDGGVILFIFSHLQARVTTTATIVNFAELKLCSWSIDPVEVPHLRRIKQCFEWHGKYCSFVPVSRCVCAVSGLFVSLYCVFNSQWLTIVDT